MFSLRNAVSGLTLLSASVLGLLAGCANETRGKLEGRWFGDSVTHVDASRLAAATGWARGMSFEFSGSNVTVAIPTELPRTGPYEVVRADEQGVLLAIRRPDGALDSAHLTFDSDQQLRWHIGEGRSIILRRMN